MFETSKSIFGMLALSSELSDAAGVTLGIISVGLRVVPWSQMRLPRKMSNERRVRDRTPRVVNN